MRSRALFFSWLLGIAIILALAGRASAQVGVIIGPGHSPLSCTALSAGVPTLRPEGYTELVGDILIECTGGGDTQVGTAIPTTNIIVYMSPSVPISSRVFGPGPNNSSAFVSEALLMIDEPGTGEITGATGGYGPQAPQSLCSSAQQQNPGGSTCPAFVGVDNSGNYLVPVVAPGSATPAANVYQGEVGDFGLNSVAFYNVPVLPPASNGVSRIFHITNIRVAVPGFNLPGTLQAFISSSGNQSLPIQDTTVNIGALGNPTLASVNASPTGGGNPFSTCAAVTTPALASRITFTEGFATAFKTRVVPGGAGGGNTIWAAEAQNLVSPANQNIPGGNYGGFSVNNESGFILPALAFTDSTSNITYTAGLADFGTRLKAVFSNIPSGVTVYVSTTNSATVTVPGGTSVTPYAVLVAAGQTAEANNDGSTFAPLTSAITGSDGLSAYPLDPDNSGATAAIWEVVNANSGSQDVLTISVYIAYNASTFGTVNPTNVALSYAPEPGGGSFTTANAAYGLTSPSPRFGILGAQGGPFATINLCAISVYGGTPVNFAYPIGGSVTSGGILEVATSPSNLTVTVTPSVTTPSGGSWLSASLNSGILGFSINPANLAASPTAYTGSVKLSAAGQSVSIPVTLTVYPPAQFTVTSSHTVNFAQGQSGSYSVVVSNASQSSATTGSVTVTESFSSGLSLGSMNGTGWNCNTAPTCYRSDSLNPGASFDPINVTVNVAPNATSPQTNAPDLSSPGLLDVLAFDPTIVTGTSCDVKQIGSFTIGDLHYVINEALGVSSAGNDINFDGVVNVADIQLVLNSVLTQVCVI
jgi:hypothetical protein